MAKTHTYENANGTTFQWQKEIAQRTASGVVGVYNITIHLTGEDLAQIQQSQPELTEKKSLEAFVRQKIGVRTETPKPQPVAQLPPVTVEELPPVTVAELPPLAVADNTLLPPVDIEQDEALLQWIVQSAKVISQDEIKKRLMNFGKSEEVVDYHIHLCRTCFK